MSKIYSNFSDVCVPGVRVRLVEKTGKVVEGNILDVSARHRTIQLDDTIILDEDIASIEIIRKLADKNYESTDKMVSHPDHYQSTNGLEVIDAIEAFTDGLNGIEATDTGNIIKYACRWHKKNGIQDLEKILWYTQHLINHLKKKESNMS